jgi:hypothetical protein
MALLTNPFEAARRWRVTQGLPRFPMIWVTAALARQ